MVEPLSTTVLGTTLLQEGIKFLYGQAGELLKRWRERRDADKATDQSEPLLEPPPGLLATPVVPTPPNYDVVEARKLDLEQLRKFFFDYVDGMKDSSVDDELLQEKLELGRLLLEQIYGQHITFARERSAKSKISSCLLIGGDLGESGDVKGIVHHEALQPDEEVDNFQQVSGSVHGKIVGVILGKHDY